MRRLAILLVLAGIGCGKRQSNCRADAYELAELLRKANTGPQPFYLEGIQLVIRPDLPRRAAAWSVSVEIGKDGVRFHDRRVAPDELAGLLTEARSSPRYSSIRDRDDQLLNLAIDQAARWDAVVAVAEAARAAGFTRVGFAFELPPSGPPPPPRSAVDDELDRILHSPDPSNRATELARVAERVVKPCPALTRAFGSVAAVEGDKAEMIIAGIEEGLVECNCTVDLPSLRSLMYRMLHEEHVAVTIVRTLSPDGARVEHPAATTWRDAAAAIQPGDAPIWLATK